MKLMSFEVLSQTIAKRGFSFEKDGQFVDVIWSGRLSTAPVIENSVMYKLAKCHRKIVYNHFGVKK